MGISWALFVSAVRGLGIGLVLESTPLPRPNDTVGIGDLFLTAASPELDLRGLLATLLRRANPALRLDACMMHPTVGRQIFGADTCLTVNVNPFEESDLPAASFDLGVAATVFHWLDQEVALIKIAHALRPGGWWAMWWNVFGDPTRRDDFHEATRQLFTSVEHTPSTGEATGLHYGLDVDARLLELVATQQFDSIQHELLRWTMRRNADEIVALYGTFSPILLLPPSDRERFLASLHEIAERQFGGVVERPMVTPIYTARRA
jgi:hypothetical protein